MHAAMYKGERKHCRCHIPVEYRLHHELKPWEYNTRYTHAAYHHDESTERKQKSNNIRKPPGFGFTAFSGKYRLEPPAFYKYMDYEAHKKHYAQYLMYRIPYQHVQHLCK
jgi:hypothetical protein